MRLRVLLLLLAVTPVARAQTLVSRSCERIAKPQAEGLSGIAYAGGETYWSVADTAGKLVRMEVTQGDDATIKSAKITQMIDIKVSDPEGIALRDENAIVANESPGLFEARLRDGEIMHELAVPQVMKNIVPNQGFESLTISPDGKTLWTANERALTVDGNPKVAATPILSQTRVRLLRYDADLNPREQYEYDTSGVHDWGGQIGLCDLAALPN